MQVRYATGVDSKVLEAIVRWVNTPKKLKLPKFYGLTHETQLLIFLKKVRHNASDTLLCSDFQVDIEI